MRFDDYARKVGYRGGSSAELATLGSLHAAHRRTFLFENIDIQRSRPIRLDQESLERKFLDEGRGGYCFENNLLFRSVLDVLGFSSSILLARVRRGPPELWIRTHMLLRVTVDGQAWIADVGFGAVGILAPMPLRDGAIALQGGLTYRLRREAHQWILSMRGSAEESDLYEFSDDPQTVADVEMANYFTSTHPESIFRRSLTVQRAAGEERLILRGATITRYRNGAMTEQQIDASSIRQQALELFGLTLPETELLFEAAAESQERHG